MPLRPAVWLGLAWIAGEALVWWIGGLWYGVDAARCGTWQAFCILSAGMAGCLMIGWLSGQPGTGRRYRLHLLCKRTAVLTGRQMLFGLILVLMASAGFCRLKSSLSESMRADLLCENRDMEGITGMLASCSLRSDGRCELTLSGCETGSGIRIPLLLVRLPCADGVPLCGSRVRVSGDAAVFDFSRGPGMFDAWWYYHADGYAFAVEAKTIEDTGNRLNIFYASADRLRRYLRAGLMRWLNEETCQIALSMMLGERRALSEDVKTPLELSGITHVLVISGLHISLFGMGLFRLLRKCMVPLPCCVAAVLPVITGYAWLTGGSTASVRAVVMTVLGLCALPAGRRYDLWSGLSAAALVVLIYSPMRIGQPAFLLSFGACVCMGAAQRVREVSGRRLAPLFISVGMLPLTAWCFYRIPVYSLFLNLIILPGMSLLLPLLACTACIGGIWPAGACLCGRTASVLCGLGRMLAQISLSLPGSVVICGKPALWRMILAYAAMFFLMKLYFRCRKLYLPAMAACFCVCLVFLPHVHRTLSVTMIDVGQGDAFLIETPEGMHILVDGGSSGLNEAGIRRIRPVLMSRGISKLDCVFLTHMDEDHINGVRQLMEAWKDGQYGRYHPGCIEIGHLAGPMLPAGSESEAKWQDLTALAGCPCSSLARGDLLYIGDAQVIVLSPERDALPEDANEGSLVAEIRTGSSRLLFTGDIGAETEAQILDALAEGQVSGTLAEDGIFGPFDLMKAAHHGSAYSTSRTFVDAVLPACCLISCGRGNRYGHPAPQTLDRLACTGCKTFVSAESGTVTCFFETNRIRIIPWLENGMPAAGLQ